MRAVSADQQGQKSGQAACAKVRKSWPLRSLECLQGALAQTGLSAAALPRRARSRCDSPRSPSAQSGAPVYGVRAVALAPNSRADFLLKLFDGATGQGGQDRVRRCARTPHKRPRARAAAPPAHLTEPARLRRLPPAFDPRRALSPLLPGPCAARPRTRLKSPQPVMIDLKIYKI